MINKINMFFDKYQLIFLAVVIIDFFLLKIAILSFILLLYYLLNLIIKLLMLCFSYLFKFSILNEKKKYIKKIFIKTTISLFVLISIVSLGNIWDNQIKEKTVLYYNQSKLTSGHEETEITALNSSTIARIYSKNNEKTVHIILFNYKNMTYDNKNKWRQQ